MPTFCHYRWITGIFELLCHIIGSSLSCHVLVVQTTLPRPRRSSRWERFPDSDNRTPPGETSRRHFKQMPEAPRVAPLDIEEQWMSELPTLSEPLLGKPLVFVLSFFQSLLTPHDHRWQEYWLIGKLKAFPSGSARFFTTTHQHSISLSIPFLSLSLANTTPVIPELQKIFPDMEWVNPSFSNREPWPQTQRCWSSS